MSGPAIRSAQSSWPRAVTVVSERARAVITPNHDKVDMKRHIRNLFATSFLCAAASALALTACDDTTPGDSPAPATSEQVALLTPAQLGLGNDWTEQAPGLWSRLDADGAEEFVGIGEAGKRHGIASLMVQEERLAGRVADFGTEEAKAQLAEIQGLIRDLEQFEVKAPPEVEPRCQLTLNHTAAATPHACGAKANASVNYSNPCYAANETIYTYTSATCGVVTTTHSCGNRTGNPVSCASSSIMTGAAPCDSYALAQSNYYSTWKQNFVRGTCASDPPPGGDTGDDSGGGCVNCSANQDCHCVDFCWPSTNPCP